MAVTKEQNKQLQKLNTELEKKVLQRTEQLHKKHEQLKRLYKSLQINFRDTVRVFVELMEMYDPFLGGHAKRVAIMSRNLAERMSIKGVDLDLTEIAASLHDIGLIGMPKEIYREPYHKLTKPQQALFRSHPEIGYSLLYKIEFLRQAAVVVKSHHERFDGKGFPDGLPDLSIPEGARIIHAVSNFDMFVHRDGMDQDEAVSELKKQAGSVLDPTIVHAIEDTLHTIRPVQTEFGCTIKDLEPGMKLARDIKTISGRMLMTKGSTLTEAHIIRLKQFSKIDPIVDRIYVYK